MQPQKKTYDIEMVQRMQLAKSLCPHLARAPRGLNLAVGR
jgi:hypothetical protein